MLSIAKRARASNETLYRWYGNKQGLFKGLVEANAAHVAALLEAAIEEGKDPTQTLVQVGPLLIELVTSEKAVALNRAAAADATETGHGDGHLGFAHRVHVGGDDRKIDPDALGELGFERHVEP